VCFSFPLLPHLGLTHCLRLLDFAEYIVATDEKQYRVLPENSGLPWSVYVGAAGMPGKTAYMAWKASSFILKLCMTYAYSSITAGVLPL
jgi:NADPH-dependent curcumin reductase CurA